MSLHTIPFSRDNFGNICQKLENGEVFIFPSDTSYGFSCSPFSRKALEKIRTIKRRSEKKPFLLLVSDLSTAEKYGTFSPEMKSFAQKRWNQKSIPTTVLVPKKNILRNFFPDFKEVGLRVPTNSFLREFLKQFGKPLVSTSANISGEQSLFDTESIRNIFFGEDIFFTYFGDLPRKSQSQIWKEENTKLIRVR